ncbi:MAG: hypothetical protein ACOC7Y_02305 [Chloroflexota bacterium]
MDRLSVRSERRVMCSADFMGRPRCLLEVRREALYGEMPVPAGWHEAYGREETDTRGYRRYADSCLRGVGGWRENSLATGEAG